jgi:predicted nucleic acid-binding protein
VSRFLLDTTALIDLSKGREPAVSRLKSMIAGGDEVAVCAIQVAEFYRGIPPANRQRWDEFFEALAYWEISRAAATQAGVIRYDFDRTGIVLSLTDTLIAAVALERQATLVTNNLKHYPMKGIQLLALR